MRVCTVIEVYEKNDKDVDNLEMKVISTVLFSKIKLCVGRHTYVVNAKTILEALDDTRNVTLRFGRISYTVCAKELRKAMENATNVI